MATQKEAAKGVESVTDYVKATTIDASAADLSSLGAASSSVEEEAQAEVSIPGESVSLVASELMISREQAFGLLTESKGSVEVVFERFTSS